VSSAKATKFFIVESPREDDAVRIPPSMKYSYPAPRTGTSQDLLRIVTLAAERDLALSGVRLPEKSERQRRWIEPVFRAVGIAFAAVLEAAPADWSVAFHDRLFTYLAAPRGYAFEPGAPELVRARRLRAELARRGGREPALLALISHPPVLGDLNHMNFALVRHAMLALRAVRDKPCRPRLVVATDPFALDGTSIAEEGLYAGFMGHFHVGIDRLSRRGHPGPTLSPQTDWSAMPQRLFRLLAEGGEAGLVLSGGVPTTGRVLYGAREWARSALERCPRRGSPLEVLRALDADAGYRRFSRELADLPRPSNVWRRLEAWLMAAAAGLVPGQSALAAAGGVLDALAVPADARAALLAELGTDLERETPRRRRLFRLLAGRVARRRPVVLIPIVHSTEPLGIAVREAWGWEWAGPGRVRASRADAPEAARETGIDAFADLFVEENFR
jgi:hypothetical protein